MFMRNQMISVRSYRSLQTFSQPSFVRSISSTPRLESFGWFDKIKNVFTGKSPETSAPPAPSAPSPPSPPSSPSTPSAPFTPSAPSASTFSLTDFADQMEKAQSMGMLKQYAGGRCSEATVADAFKKQSSILRYLGSIDHTGEKLQPLHKHEATKRCNCTISEVEHILAKYKWAKDAQKKIDELSKQGKPLPKDFNEVQKLMGSTPLDVARSNLSKSGKVRRNDPCSCGSGKKYKRCCGPP